MRTGQVEANLLHLNEEARLPYIGDLIARKTGGPEKCCLEQADLKFYESEYERLRAQLQTSYEQSRLPETPDVAAALNDLLIRVRLKAVTQKQN